MSRIIASSTYLSTQTIITALLLLICCSLTHESRLISTRDQQPNQDWKSLISTLFQDIARSREITQFNCFLSIIVLINSSRSTLSSADFTIHWKLFKEPYLLNFHFFHQKYNQTSYERVDILDNKFRSSCWTNLVLIFHKIQTRETPRYSLKRDEIILPPSISAGLPSKSIYDQFIFISDDEDTLKSVLSNSTASNNRKIVNAATRKYGMYFNNKLPDQVGYYVEPNSYTGSFIKSSHITFKNKLNNINGRTLTVLYLPFPPFLMNREVGGKIVVEGQQATLVKEIATRENATLIFRDKVKTPGYGMKLPNGTWTGIVGELVEGSADLTPVLGATYARFPYLSWTTPSYLVCIFFCVKEAIEERQWQALIYPLSLPVWLLTLLTFIVFLIVFLVKTRMEHQKGYDRLSPALVLTIWMQLYTMLLDQSSPLPQRNLSRLIILLWIIFCYLIGLAYKANLVGYLTFTEKKELPQTFKDLYHSPEYSIVLQTIGGLELELFRTSPSPIMKGIARKMELDRNIRSCLLKAAANHVTACIAWGPAITTAIAKYSAENKELKTLFLAKKETGGAIHGSFAMKKESIFQEVMVRYIGWARAGDLIQRWCEMATRQIEVEAKELNDRKGLKKNGGVESIDELDRNDDETKPLARNDLLVVFFMMVIGVALSTGSMIVELMLVYIKFNRQM